MPGGGGCSAGREHGRDRAPVRHAARPYERELVADRCADQLEQREQPDLTRRCVVEAAAMPARFAALHDQGVSANGARGLGFACCGHRDPDRHVDLMEPVDVLG